MSKLHLYEVRLERYRPSASGQWGATARARRTVQVLSPSAPEAREQALHGRTGESVVACRRSQYAPGLAHREARRRYLQERQV